MSSGSGHLEFLINTRNTNFLDYQLLYLLTNEVVKFAFNWISVFADK